LNDKVTAAFQAHFYDPVKKIYNETGRASNLEYLSIQTCISLAADLGVIPSEDYDAVIANLVQDVMVENNGHLNTGIVGLKYLLPTLSEGGRNDVALAVMQTPTEPGFVYMLQQGATTLWETWTGSRYHQDASWNHIMFGQATDWSFKYLGGIQQAEGSRGFKQIVIKPQVYANGSSICGTLSSVEASLIMPVGLIRSSWQCGASYDVCNEVEENAVAHLSCQQGVITKIDFAGFGTPNGSCQSGFVNWNCTSANSMTVVSKDCLNKASCSISASNDHFGGDPCLDVPKRLAVGASGCTNGRGLFNHSVEIPVGATATIYLSTFGGGAGDVIVFEGKYPVFSKGQYVPGTPGITNAEYRNGQIVVSAGSGTYDFVINSTAAIMSVVTV